MHPAADPYAEPRREVVEPLRPLPPRRRRKRWPWLLLAALAGLGLALVLVSALTPERVQLPTVVGSSISVATQRLQSEGFEVVSVRDNSDKPRNTVIGQDPPGGTTLAKGSRVTLTVSEGPAISEVPDVVGDGRLTARRKLTAAGFEVQETRIASESVAADRVISQSPDGGSLAETGKTVRIAISTGREQLAVPGVVGRSLDDARAALEGFRVVVQEREDAGATPGRVLAQSPARGAAVPRGSTVTLTVAAQPSRAEVPDVLGRSEGTARDRLAAAGLEVAVEEVPVDSVLQDGRVQEQSPAAGRTVERGSTVTISVGRRESRPRPPTNTTTTPSRTTTTPAPP